MANSVIQTIRDAEVDARSLSEFIYNPADAMISRRLAPSIHSLQYYLNFLDAIPSIVQNAIDNTAVEGGVLADTFVTATANGVGTIARTQRDKNSEIVTLADYGGVSDYSGQPLYDGNDEARIEATDNTEALQGLINDAIRKGRRAVKIGAGHWGIRVGNLIFDGFDSLHIYGEGMDVTTIDFIKEDASATSYVDTKDAHSVATFKNGASLRFSNLTLKATTKSGVVSSAGGNPTLESVYLGKVWGINAADIDVLTLENVRFSHFNYRGLSADRVNRVSIINCEGHYNIGSGFWLSNCEDVTVSGGEFSYNGIKGNPGTGYGITLSSANGSAVIEGVYAHHNYRKGIDTHGCRSFTVKNCVLQDNVAYHIAAALSNYTNTNNDTEVFITDNILSNGLTQSSEDWLRSCYQAISVNNLNFTGGCNISVTDSVSTPHIDSVTIKNNIIKSSYLGYDTLPADTYTDAAIYVYSGRAKAKLQDNELDFSKMLKDSTSNNAYSKSQIRLEVNFFDVVNNSINVPDSAKRVGATGLSEYGVVFNTGVKNSAASGNNKVHSTIRHNLSGNRITVFDSGILGAVAGTSISSIYYEGDYNVTYRDNTIKILNRYVNPDINNTIFPSLLRVRKDDYTYSNNFISMKGVATLVNHPQGIRQELTQCVRPTYEPQIGKILANILIPSTAKNSTLTIRFVGAFTPMMIELYIADPSDSSTVSEVSKDSRLTYTLTSRIDAKGEIGLFVGVTADFAADKVCATAVLESSSQTWGIESFTQGA